MARDLFINGPATISIGGSPASLSGSPSLGLTSDQVRISPKTYYKPIHVDDYGGEVPADLLFMLGTVDISFTLIHFDRTILDTCISESMAGGTVGTMQAAGTPMAASFPAGAGSNHFLSLSIASSVGNKPWTFPTAYLSEQPIEFPLGNDRSLVACNFRAFPYNPYDNNGEVFSSGAPLWQYQ